MSSGSSALSQSDLHVGVDATTWANDRGFGRFTRELVKALARRDSGIRYSLVFDQPPDFDLPEGVDYVSASTTRSLNESSSGTNSRSIGYLWKMGAVVRKANFDVFFFPAVYSYFPLLANVPRVICYHDATAERFHHLLFPTKLNHRLWQLKTALAKMQTTRAMTISRSSADDLENILGFPADKIDLVTEGADAIFRKLDDESMMTEIRKKYGIPSSVDILLSLGGMNAHKNIFSVLKAMPDIIDRQPGVHLVIVGDTSGKGFWDNVPELMAFVNNNAQLQEHVHFTGYASDSDVVKLLNTSAALVFPSLWEGFGLPAVEAMSCGVPVLSSDRGSLPEVIEGAGLFYDPLDLDDITRTILRFFEEPGLRERLKSQAQPQSAKFSWDRGAEMAERCFLRCAGRDVV